MEKWDELVEATCVPHRWDTNDEAVSVPVRTKHLNGVTATTGHWLLAVRSCTRCGKYQIALPGTHPTKPGGLAWMTVVPEDH